MTTVIAAAGKKAGGGGGKGQRGFGEAGGAKRGGSGGGGSGGGGGGGGGRGKGKQGAGGRGGGGSKQGSGGGGGGSTQTVRAAAPPPPAPKVTPPLSRALLDALSGWERAPAPLWGTFCGHLEGEWLGQYAAYTPWGAEPEPVWADADGRYLLHAYSRASERRDAERPEGDLLVRTTRRAAYLSELLAPAGAAAAAEGADASGSSSSSGGIGGGGGGNQDDDEDEEEGFAYNAGGAVVFDGGSYSAGPADIGALLDALEADESDGGDGDGEGGDGDDGGYAPSAEELLDAAVGRPEGAFDLGGDEDEGEDEDGGGDGYDAAADDPAFSSLPVATVVVEQALTQGGQERRRLVATLKCRRPPEGSGEVDVAVARLVLFTEHWSGAAPEAGRAEAPLRPPPAARGFGTAAPDLPRAAPAQLSGAWNVFGVSAAPVVEEDPDTGADR